MRKSYTSDGIEVTFDPEVCQHSGNCVRGLPEVFNTKNKPWIDPAQADPEAVAATVRTCPSGALQYKLAAAD